MSVLIVGDSLGVGLAQHLSAYSVSQQSVSTAEWAARARSAIASYNPDVVLIVLGTNDMSKGRPASETASAGASIVQAAEGKFVLWVLPPNQPAVRDTRGTIAAIQSVAPNIFDSRQYNIPLSSDGVHPTGQGYQIWASAILARLNSVQVGASSSPQGGGLFTGEIGSLPQILFFGLLAFVVLGFLED